MKILMLFQSPPLPPPRDLGSAKRNFPFFLENLKRHEVSVIAFGSKEEEALFRAEFGGVCRNICFVDRRRPRVVNGVRQVGNLLTGRSTFQETYHPEVQEAIDRFTREEAFDLIHSCFPFFGLYRFPAGVPRLTDTHNVEYDLVRRTLREDRRLLMKPVHYLNYHNTRHHEIACCRRFATVVTTTQRDLDMFRQNLPDTPMRVIQNGVDPMFFAYPATEPKPSAITFVGLMNWYPNQQAVLHFLDEIFPLIREEEPDATVSIVGANPPREIAARNGSHIEVTGWVTDVRPYMARGQVFVIPLLIGSGIRGKALEAMAMRRPIVSTTLGCAGIDLRHEESALFADTPRDFAAAVVRVFREPHLRERLVANALATVRAKHEWTAQGLLLEDAYRELVREHASTPRS